MNASQHSAAKSDINVTPLIDIVLVLLIVFIVMVPGLMKASSVVVPRPATPPPPGTKPPASVVLTLDADGKLFLQREEILLTQLVERLVPVVRKQTPYDRKVFLKVDGDLPHQRAVDVLDQIRIASDRAKQESRADASKNFNDGGDVKVIVTLKKV